VYAEAGADVVAPSDMMDGRIGAVRRALDAAGSRRDHRDVLRGEVRQRVLRALPRGADCAPKFGDRAGYQMDPANAREALREVRLDLDEGADIVMVKPALAYLDVIAR
jgi:porphobilinogen synthase